MKVNGGGQVRTTSEAGVQTMRRPGREEWLDVRATKAQSETP